MAEQIGRTGYLGLAIEAVPGTPEATPAVYLPFSEKGIDDKHEPLPITTATASRIIDRSSKVGKKWSEGPAAIDCDVVNSGYLWKLALGNEVYTAGTPSNHEFYLTTSGNIAKSATLWAARGVTDYRRYAYSVVDSLEFAVEEELATLTAHFIGMPGTEAAAASPTTTSGTVLAFHEVTYKFGSTLVAAAAASATGLSSFKFTINNNAKALFESGSNSPTKVTWQGVKVTGSWTGFFNSTANRDAYLALQKQAVILTGTGNANEECRVRIANMRIDSHEVSEPLDDLYMATASFTAELDTSEVPNLMDVRIQNAKASLY